VAPRHHVPRHPRRARSRSAPTDDNIFPRQPVRPVLWAGETAPPIGVD